MIRHLTSAILAFGCVSAGALAQTLPNPSFEADVYTVWPGYASANGGTITGWTPSDPGRSGINSQPPTWIPANTSPFANNGIIPDGTQAGFVQSTNSISTLSNTITGLTPGTSYRLNLRFTGRANQRAQATLIAGSSTIQFEANGVEAANSFTQPYRTAAAVFIATASTQDFSIINFTVGDTTLVIDDIRVSAGSTKWSATAWTDDLSSGISGTQSYTHAYNLGSAASPTINGVPFTGVAGANPAVPGSFSTTGWTTPLADAANNVSSGDSAFMADDFVYGGASQSAQSLTLEGLSTGRDYHLTLFGVGWNDAAVPSRSATFNSGGSDILTMNEQQFGVDNGIKFELDFRALGSSQTITLTPTSSVTTIHLYGFANALIPEPSAAALIGVAGLMFSRRRSRQ